MPSYEVPAKIADVVVPSDALLEAPPHDTIPSGVLAVLAADDAQKTSSSPAAP